MIQDIRGKHKTNKKLLFVPDVHIIQTFNNILNFTPIHKLFPSNLQITGLRYLRKVVC